jgi:hypothetical protein
VSQSYNARGQDKEFALMGTMDLGSWFTQSSLSLSMVMIMLYMIKVNTNSML